MTQVQENSKKKKVGLFSLGWEWKRKKNLKRIYNYTDQKINYHASFIMIEFLNQNELFYLIMDSWIVMCRLELLV